MAVTSMPTGSANTRKIWEKKTWLQTMQQSVMGHMFNRGAVYFPKELMTSMNTKGDSITFDYVGKLTAAPVGEGETLVGSPAVEALDIGSHSMAMNTTRFGVENPADDTIEQIRTNVDFEAVTKPLLANRMIEFFDTSVFYQLAGANPTSLTINGTVYDTTAKKLHVQGHNTPVAPSANRILRPNGAASDQALTSSDTLRLDHIDYLLEMNARSDQPIEPLSDGMYDFYTSPEGLTDLMHDTTGKVQWLNIEVARLQGGKSSAIDTMYNNNMVCAGRYKNVYIYMAPRTAYGVNGSTSAVITTVRRSVLVGKDALSYGSPFGGRITDKNVPLKIKEELVDVGERKIIAAKQIYGLKKMASSNREDTGVFVISHYAAAHS